MIEIGEGKIKRNRDGKKGDDDKDKLVGIQSQAEKT